MANVAGTPVEQWRLSFPGYVVNSCPVVRSDGRLYVGLRSTSPDNPGAMAAVTKLGHLVWQTSMDLLDDQLNLVYDNVDFTNPALGADGTIYMSAHPQVVGFNGTLYAFTDNGTSGSIKWRVRPSVAFAFGGYVTAYGSSSVHQETGQICYAARVITFNSLGQISSRGGAVFMFRDDGTHATQLWSTLTVAGADLGRVESSPVVDPGGTVFVGSQALQVGPPLVETQAGRFLAMTSTTSQVMYTSTGTLNSPDGGQANVDVTACLAMNNQIPPTLNSIFTTDESGTIRKMSPSGTVLWSFAIRRTDRIDVGMGPDGVVYCTCRPKSTDTGAANHGYVYAIAGFAP